MRGRNGAFPVHEVALSLLLLLIPLAAPWGRAEEKDPFSLVNLHTQPLSLMYGIWQGEASVRVSRDVEIGAGFTWFEVMSTDQILTVRQIGLDVTVFPFGRAPNGGYFLRPDFYYLPETSEDRSGLTGTETVANYSAGLLVGREWMWPVGFNVDLAVGIAYLRSPSTEAVQLAGTTFHESITPLSQVQPVLEWSVGWAF